MSLKTCVLAALLSLAVLYLPAPPAYAQPNPSAHPGGVVTPGPRQDRRRGAPARIEDLDASVVLGGLDDGLALSPDGDRLALIGRSIRAGGADYGHDLLVIDAAGASAARIVGDGGGYLYATVAGRIGGAPLPRAPIWSPDGARIGFIAERDGRAELWVSDAESGASRRAAPLEGDVRRFAWLSDRLLAVEIGTPRDVMTAADAAARTRGAALDDRFEPVYLVGVIPDDAAGKSTWVIDLDAAVARPASEAEAQTLRAPPLAFPRAEIISTGPYPDATAAPLVPVLVTADARRQCEAALCVGRMRHVYAAQDGSGVFFIRPEAAGAEAVLHEWDIASDSVRELYRTEGVLTSCRLGQDALFCLEETPSEPRRVIAIDLASGVVRTIYDPNPHWRRIARPLMQRLDVRDASGNLSFGRLIYPIDWRRGRSYPLVIVQYRARGFLGAGVSGEYPVLPMSARGFFVLAVDRPQDEARASRFAFADYQRETELSGSELDVKLGSIALMLDHLRAEPSIDFDRLAITGMSDGAETLYAMLNRGWRFRAAIASTNPSDRSLWYFMSNTYRRDIERRLGITPPWASPRGVWNEWWDRSAAFDHTENYTAALLLNLAQSEILIAMPLITRLRHEARPLDVYLYPEAHHLKTRPSQLTAIQHRNLDWLELWLNGGETDDGLEPARRARWRALRERAGDHERASGRAPRH